MACLMQIRSRKPKGSTCIRSSFSSLVLFLSSCLILDSERCTSYDGLSFVDLYALGEVHLCLKFHLDPLHEAMEINSIQVHSFLPWLFPGH